MPGPSRESCDIVDARDRYACTRCGRSLASTHGSRHHRQLRRHGDHSPANLVLLCGSGTTGCHGWAHGNPASARSEGFIVPGWCDARKVPVGTIWGWRVLRVDGTFDEISDAEARDIMAELGLQE